MNSTDVDKYLTGEQVAEFLAKNTDFFEHYPDLLFDLKVPHESGKAISLVEKQVSVMRERNTELRRRLTQLIHNARENDRLFEHTRRLVLALLDCQSLGQVNDALFKSFDHEFKVEFTSLILFDSPPGTGVRSCSSKEAHHWLGNHLKARQTVGGGLDERERRFLFSGDAPKVASAALSILSHGDLYGVLAVGNSDEAYYRSSMGTLFLSYIGEVLGRVIHRLKTR